MDSLWEVQHARSYFDFHAAPDADGMSPETHGLFPVWGFGDIVASNHPVANVGERVYGFFAPTKYLGKRSFGPPAGNLSEFYYSSGILHGRLEQFLLLRPPTTFTTRCAFGHKLRTIGTFVLIQIVDRRPYNQVVRCAADAQYESDSLAEDLTMVYRPLYWTSFWCEDWLFTSNYRGGAKLFFISSASSKTAFCLAYRIQIRIRNKEVPADTRIIGLTSKRNMGFTKRLGLYHEVVSYDDINEKSFDLGVRAIYTDVAGSDELNGKLFAVQGPTFVAAIKLGMSNVTPMKLGVTNVWTKNIALEETAGGSSSMKTLEFEAFFMVEWLAVRVKQLSVKEIVGVQIKAWKQLIVDAKGWVEIARVYGGEQVKAAYESALRDGLCAEDGYVWSLWGEGEQAGNVITGAKCKL